MANGKNPTTPPTPWNEPNPIDSVQAAIDRYDEAIRLQNEQSLVQDPTMQSNLVKAYPRARSTIEGMVKKGVYDIDTINEQAAMEHDQKETSEIEKTWNTDPQIQAWKQQLGNPDLHYGDQEGKYDYIAAIKAGFRPTKDSQGRYHWPSQFKHDDSPERFITDPETGKQFDTKTGRYRLDFWGAAENVYRTAQETYGGAYLPFIGSGIEAMGLYDIFTAAKRLEDDTATEEDLLLLKDYIDEASADRTVAATVVEILAGLPAFAVELGLTWGVYGAAQKATIKGTSQVLKKLLSKKGRDLLDKRMAKFGLKVVGGIGGATIQSIPATAPRIVGEYYRNIAPKFRIEEGENEELEGIITGPGDDILPAFAKAFGTNWVEVVSEHSGGLFTAVGKAGKSYLLQTAARGSFAKKFFDLNPSAKVSDFNKVLRKYGWNGMVEEVLEERVGEVGRAALGIEEWKLPTRDQLLAEVIAFSIPGAGFAGARRAIAGKTTGAEGTEVRTELDRALDANEINKETHRLASYLSSQNPDIDAQLALDISGEAKLATEDYIQEVRGQSLEEFYAEEGIEVEEGQQVILSGATTIDEQTGKTIISLWGGADSNTIVEEFYHDAYNNLTQEEKNEFEAYHSESEDTRSIEEHFAQEGTSFFFENRMNEKAYSGLGDLFKKLKETFMRMVGRVDRMDQSQIPENIRAIYEQSIQPGQERTTTTDIKQPQFQAVKKPRQALFEKIDPKDLTDDASDKLLSGLNKYTELGYHPFHGRKKLVGNLGMLEISTLKKPSDVRDYDYEKDFQRSGASENTVVLDAIYSFEKGTGKGSQLLDLLLKAADDQNISVVGFISQIGTEGLNNKQLREWYTSKGFEYRKVPGVTNDRKNVIVYHPPGREAEPTQFQAKTKPSPQEPKSPYEILFEGRPTSSELDNQFENDFDAGIVDRWKSMSPLEVIAEVEEILSKYDKDSGWDHGYSLHELGDKDALKERTELRKVLSHIKRKYKKHFKDKKGEFDVKPTTTQFQAKQLEKVKANPKFKKWFGDSKVVDKDGDPMVVYHGTTEDFDEFRVPNEPSPTIYFSSNPDVASNYSFRFVRGDITNRSEYGPNVMPVYLKIENPFNYTLDLNKKEDRKVATDLDKKIYNEAFSPAVVDILKKEGYDGIVDERHNIYQVFEPTQIKSQFNIGEFDAKDPKIQFQVKTIPKAETGAPILPSGNIEIKAEEAFNRADKRDTTPSALMLKRLPGAPKKRKKFARTRDKDILVEDFQKYVDRVKETLDSNPEQANWYYDYGEGAKEIVGEDNMREFSILFGITSAQKPTYENLRDTIWIMNLARRIDPINNTKEFRKAVRGKTPTGERMLIQGKQIDKIVEAYETGTFKGGLKVSTYMQTAEAASENRFMPFTVNDIHMARFYGFMRKDKQGQSVGFGTGDTNYRYAQFLNQKISDILGLQPMQTQALAWLWARDNRGQIKGDGSFESAQSFSKEAIEAFVEVQDKKFDVFKDAPIPSYTGPTKTKQYSNVAYSPEIEQEIMRKSPRILGSFVPGVDRGFLTKEISLETANKYDNAVFDAITDEAGQLNFLKELRVPHEIQRTLGSYGKLETSYQILLPGGTLEQAKLVSLYMGDAGLQDSVIHYKTVWAEEGALGGVSIKKSDGNSWTLSEIKKFHKTVNPNQEEDGVNFYQSDENTLRVIVFPGAEVPTTKALESYHNNPKFDLGIFYQDGDLIESKSYTQSIREVVAQRPIVAKRRSDIQRTARDNLYGPIQEVYQRFESDFRETPSAQKGLKPPPKTQFQAKKIPKKSGKSIIESFEKDKSLELKDASLWQVLVHHIQDNTVRLRLLSEGLKTQGPLKDEDDLYLLSTLMTGKTGDRINIFNDDIYINENSLLQRIIKAGFSLDEFGKYMMAQHARERNDYVAKKDKKAPKDGGSGMSNADAEEVLSNYKGNKRKKIKSLAKEFRRKVTKKDLKNRLDAGLLTKEQYDNLNKTFEYYVPLRVDMGEQGIVGYISRIGGKGFDVRGKEYFGIKKGHKDKPTINPIFSAIVQHQEGIVRAEKNSVSKSFYRLANTHESSAWSVRGQRATPSYDENGEIIFFNYEQLKENELAVKLDGKTKVITINDEYLLKALKNFDKTRAVPFLRNAMNYFRTIITTMNPEFFISNWQRDVQTALINISGEESAAMAAKVVANLPNSIKGIWNEVRNKDSEWAKLYKELKATGGKVGWFNIESIEDQRITIRSELGRLEKGKGSAKRMGHKIGNFFDKLNEIVESSTRLAAYKAAKDAGMSKKRAAFLAKELTVNFNRTGAWGPYINSLYLFWNATIQGAFRVGTSFVKNPKTRMLAYAVAANSAAQAWRNRTMCRETWEKIPEWEKDNYHIFIDPDCGTYSKFRVPFGYNIFHVMGSTAMDAAMNHHQDKIPLDQIDYGKIASRTLGAVSDAVNPFGAGAKGLNVIPTLARPYFEMKGNVKWNGAPIKPEQFFVDIPKSREFFPGVSPTAKAITDWLSKSTGGKDLPYDGFYHPGLVEISPEDLEYIMDFIGGGTGKFVKRTIDTSRMLVKEGKIEESRKVPFLRLFRAEVPLKSEKSWVYQHIKKSKVKKYPEPVMKRFHIYVDILKESEQITPKEAKRITTLMTNNQMKLRGVYQEKKSRSKPKKPKLKGRRPKTRRPRMRTP